MAEELRGGDPAAAGHVLQHTERRYPGVYAIVPEVGVADQGKGHGWLRILAEATGGMWMVESGKGLVEQFAEILLTACEDLRHGHTMTVEIPSEDRVPLWKSITVRTDRKGVTLNAPTQYEASGSVCAYLGSHLATEDPITRLVATGEAGSCWERPGTREMLMHRLYEDSPEENSLVRDELYRSLIKVAFRLLQSPARGVRRETCRNLGALLARSDQDESLRDQYRLVAERIRHRPVDVSK